MIRAGGNDLHVVGDQRRAALHQAGNRPSSATGRVSLLSAKPLRANSPACRGSTVSGISILPKLSPPELNAIVKLYLPGAIRNSFS